MIRLLFIDTSSDIGTVAISANEKILAYRTNTDTRDHARVINIMINEILAEVSMSLRDLSGIIVCAGPGSYTGLRIGLATAKALCYVLGKPLFLHNKLTLLCDYAYYNNLGKYDAYVSLLVAREQEYFITAHDNNFNCFIAPQHIMGGQIEEMIKDFKNVLIITDADNNTINRLTTSALQIEKNTLINLNNWLSFALKQYECNNSVNLSTAAPFYLKQVYTHK
jgi:tRNA threonylcarbamoyladenosine biosynthesis protein TsaB